MKLAIGQFLQCKNIAIVGMSAKNTKFGNLAYKELSKKNFTLYPIHPKAKKIDGAQCFANFNSIEDKIDGVLISVQPSVAEKVVKSAHEVGIKNVWLQQGALSDYAIQFCLDNGINVVHNECILMFAEPVKSFHKFHRWVWKIFGKLPK
ncbi:MAG: CoA-binding protein [Candidatus Marinimicrobia bacterium]|nr:CoA-binding protein [Candidatus Neomarinimicrobiota bacterium]